MLNAYLRPALAWLVILIIGAAVYMALPDGEGSWRDRKAKEEGWSGESGLAEILEKSGELFSSHDELLSYKQFSDKWQEYKDGKISTADMLALCDRVLAKDAAGNATYRARVYADRGFVFFYQNNIAEAEANAQLAMDQDSRRGFGQYLLYYIREYQGRVGEAADMLGAAWKGGQLTMSKEEVKEKIAKLRAAAVVIDSRDLEAEFVADAAAASRKYAKKDITVRGKVMDIDTSMRLTLKLEGSLPGHGVFCDFFLEGVPGAAGITKGQVVTVYGSCMGLFSEGFYIVDCKVIKVEPCPQTSPLFCPMFT